MATVSAGARARRVAVTEREFTRDVIRLARTLGYHVHHSLPAQNARGRHATWLQGHPGLPDLIMARARPRYRLIFAELKSEHGVLSALQAEWLTVLGGLREPRPMPWEVYLWYPWEMESIAAILNIDTPRAISSYSGLVTS